ncbi:unnamed protein product [Symbiodinium sp. CCMP2592]|nr:unnamed protein product [Symbiodinium sp. CCMP2592]
MIASIPGIVGTPTVLGLGGVQAPVLGYQPVTFSCVRGATCQIRIPAANGTGVVPSGSSSLLVVAGETTCGSTSLQELATLPRAATGVLASNPVDASSPSATSVRLVSLGEPILEGSYTLCFCAGSDSGSGACALDRDFFSLVGSLTVRGPAASNALYCVVSQNCSLALWGVELSVWDWILVREEGSGSCFDSSRVGFQASDKFLINPAGLPQEDIQQQWIFDLGTSSQTGQYQLCYCAGYKASPGSSAAPCQAPADFTMQVGTLVVRGLQDTGLSFGCVKSSKGDGQAQCALPVQGSSLIPEQDKMLVMPLSDTTSCGEVAASRGFGISPNPIPISLANTTGAPVLRYLQGSVR